MYMHACSATVHISNLTTTKDVSVCSHSSSLKQKFNYYDLFLFSASQLVQILLKKFCVTDNPKKFSLYEEYGGDCKTVMLDCTRWKGFRCDSDDLFLLPQLGSV